VSAVAQPLTRAAPGGRVTRSRRSALWSGVLGLVLVVVLALLPYIVYSGTTNLLVDVFTLMSMATMWNLLAGYAGLVSVGQQAFLGVGAYSVLIMAQHGVNPFAALPLAAVVSGVVGLPVWWLVSRLRTGYFAIATWVIASVGYLTVLHFPSLGGGTGASLLPYLGSMNATLLSADTYWVSLAVVVVVLAATYLLLRSRLGLVLTAVRDDEVGASSVGARVSSARRLVFVVAATGCGAAGALLIISQLNVEPASIFGVQWSAEMIFVTIIGGIGTIEGPILGTIIFFALQQNLSSYGAWYLIILGLVAITIAIWSRRGLWGLVADRTNIRLFPVGYYLWPAGEGRRRRLPWPRPGPAVPAETATGAAGVPPAAPEGGD
jgi:ABC-type branched-subunit amino acid transport system permease subunit